MLGRIVLVLALLAATQAQSNSYNVAGFAHSIVLKPGENVFQPYFWFQPNEMFTSCAVIGYVVNPPCIAYSPTQIVVGVASNTAVPTPSGTPTILVNANSGAVAFTISNYDTTLSAPCFRGAVINSQCVCDKGFQGVSCDTLVDAVIIPAAGGIFQPMYWLQPGELFVGCQVTSGPNYPTCSIAPSRKQLSFSPGTVDATYTIKITTNTGWMPYVLSFTTSCNGVINHGRCVNGQIVCARGFTGYDCGTALNNSFVYIDQAYIHNGYNYQTFAVDTNGLSLTQTTNGHWNDAHPFCATWSSNANYLYCIRKIGDSHWWTRQMFPDGTLGTQIQAGQWAREYNVVVSMKVGRQNFLYTSMSYPRQSQPAYYNVWLIDTYGATLSSSPVQSGYRVSNKGYASAISCQVQGRTFLFNQQSGDDNPGEPNQPLPSSNWCIDEVLSDGSLNQCIHYGLFSSTHALAASYTIAGRTFIYILQNHIDNVGFFYWDIYEVNSDGSLTGTDSGTIHHSYSSVTVIETSAGHFLYGVQGFGDDIDPFDYHYKWWLNRLNPGGTMGGETASGHYDNSYDECVGYSFTSNNNLLISSRYTRYADENETM